MINRLRIALLSAVTLVAVGLCNVTMSTPAHAAGDGNTCMDPVITGTVEKASIVDQYGHTLNFARFTQSGFTSANCPPPLVDYRYKVTYNYDGRTSSVYNTDLQPSYRLTPQGLVRNGTKIIFPSVLMSFSGYKDVAATVTSGSKSVLSNTWCRSNETAYDYVIKKEQWLDWQTIDGVPRGRINACP
jgi:hypothetical protein